ncbi:AI-2E family transporter [Lyngbya aestuarii]|uniref:AI-2E family transporter n=1 Tax=Lyngbya aestuarii TaxID=118322 RepID=UPI00403E12FB
MPLGSLVGFLVLVISLYILWRIQQVILLAFAAVVFATTTNRLVRFLQRSHIKRGIAVALSVSLILALLVGFFALVVPPFIEQVQQLVELVPQGLDRLRSWTTWLRNLLPDQLLDELRDLGSFTENLQSWSTRLFGNFFNLFYSSLGVVLNTLLVIVVTIMLLANPSPYREAFILLFPAFYRQRVDEILHQCEDTLGGWAIGILFNMTVITILSGLGLWILGVQLPLANALLAGFLTFIPNVGPTLSVIPPTALALLDAPWKALAVIGLYVLIQQTESNILTPLVMKKQVSLLPAITLLSQVAFAVFFGILGLLLALPIVVVVQVWLKEVLVKDVLNNWQSPSKDHQRQDSPATESGQA